MNLLFSRVGRSRLGIDLADLTDVAPRIRMALDESMRSVGRAIRLVHLTLDKVLVIPPWHGKPQETDTSFKHYQVDKANKLPTQEANAKSYIFALMKLPCRCISP